MTFELDATESGSPIDIPSGVYGGTVAAIERAEGQFYVGGQVKFVITVDGQVTADGEPVDIWAYANAKLSTKSKLWRWAKALGCPPVIGQAFDVERFTGLRCGVLVEREETVEGVRCRVKELLQPVNGSQPQVEAEPRCGECFGPLGEAGYFTANLKTIGDKAVGTGKLDLNFVSRVVPRVWP